VGACLGCDAREVVFTSGGTESDNLAIFGIARRRGSSMPHVISSTIEHPAVLNACAQLEREGAEVTYVPVGRDGVILLNELRRALRPETVLITVMHANNETGTLQPIREIAEMARAHGAMFHSDGVQVAGRMPVNVRELGVDLYSISGHKFGAPKGIGALYVRKGVPLEPILFGGHHERDRRAGTENVPGAVALGRAVGLASGWAETAVLRDRLEHGILRRIAGASVNGPESQRDNNRIPNTTNIRFDGIEGEAIVIALDLRGYAVSSGSACSSGAVEPSHVLLAMGLSPEDARSSVRFSLGPENTANEVDGLIEAVDASVAHLRRISPAMVVNHA
jgi:cysteine desulfurase